MNSFKKILILCSLVSCFLGCASKQQAGRAALFLQIGDDAIEQRDYPSALTNLLEADRLDPDNPRILNSLGMLYFHREKYEDALVFMERAIHIEPKYSDARNNYARVLIALGQYDSAIQQIHKVLKDLTYPQLDKAYTNLGLAYFRKDQFKKARPQFQRAITSNRNFCPAYNLYGQTLLKLNEFESAGHVFDQALRMCETDLEELNYFSALNDYQLGKKSQAKVHLQEIIRSNPGNEYAEKAQKLLTALEDGKQQGQQ